MDRFVEKLRRPFQLQLNPPTTVSQVHRKHPLLLFFVLSLGLRITYLSIWGPFLFPDSVWRYIPISESLFGSWSGSEYDTPGYPAFLALGSWLQLKGGSVIFLQGLLDSLTVAMIFDIARRMGLQKSALVIGVFFSLHFGAITLSATILSETLFTFSVIGAVWCFFQSNKNSHPRLWILAGLFLAVAALTRANGLMVTLAIGAGIGATRWSRPTWQHLVPLGLAVGIPIMMWITFNGRTQGVWAIARGGGWQWLQNMAYFDLVDPQTLPEPFVDDYVDWKSLSEIRTTLMLEHQDSDVHPNQLFSKIAKVNALENPGSYLKTIPEALLLPRRFIKDLTRMPFALDQPQTDLENSPYAAWLHTGRSQKSQSVFGPFFQVCRALTIIPYKYTLLLLALPFVLYWGWRARDARLFLLGLLPASQALPLALFLNPIERYYFPFESLMIIGLVAGIISSRRAPKLISISEKAVP